jgi:predicted amidohydrolase
MPGPNPAFLDNAWVAVASCALCASVAVVLGTERVTLRGLLISALVINSDGSVTGWQDKEQIDPSEELVYVAGEGRRVFQSGPLTFGIVICHEGWRYPETVRWAARRGAQVVFHPHAHVAEPESYRPSAFLDPANTFHEKSMLCRAAENTCYFASVNCASEGSGTTSAVIRPDGTVQCFQPYGLEGLLIADIDLNLATGLLASRCRGRGL